MKRLFLLLLLSGAVTGCQDLTPPRINSYVTYDGTNYLIHTVLTYPNYQRTFPTNSL